MTQSNPPQSSLQNEKIYDDLIDLIIYAAFTYSKLQNDNDTPIDILIKAGEAYIAKRDEYRDAWKLMDIEELIAGLRLKAGRINAMFQNSR